MASSRNLPSTSKQTFHEKIYLHTHIWQSLVKPAKHFHMINKWKHKIPDYSNDKSLTASYRAITQNCLLQDISYYTCIEIVGEKNLMEATLKKHCDPRKIFAAKLYDGQEEGTVMFFKKNGYPQFPIGYVNFFWKIGETNVKTIWIWVHPAFYSDFLSEIISSFEFKQNNPEQDRTDISHNLNDLYTNNAGCKMLVLKYALNRFRLSGPAALTVLEEILHLPSLTELNLVSKNCSMTEEQDSSLNDEKLDTMPSDNVSMQPVEKMVIDGNEKDTKDLTVQDLRKKMWHTKYYKEGDNIRAFNRQDLTWNLMKVLGSPSLVLPSNMIIGLTVLDPHFYLPVRRTKIEAPSSAEHLGLFIPNISRSPIWDAKIRQIVSNSCGSTNIIEFMRVAGMSDDPNFNKDAGAKIPILLVQKPELASLGLGSSIDLIMPSRWAMAFWIALITRSPSVGGLRETKLAVFESLGTHVPDINDPDTPAYKREALKRRKKLTNKYLSRSPSQRVNFIKYGIHSPFFCDWKFLTKGWSNVEDFYVLRDFRLLAYLREEIKTNKCKHVCKSKTVQESKFDFQKFDQYKNCLVQVYLSVVFEGTPKEFAIICMPTHEDMRRFKSKNNFDGPVEKRHNDPNETSRKMLFKLHLMQVKQPRWDGMKLEKTFQDIVSPKELHPFQDEINGVKRRQMISYLVEEMRKLYLPESMEVRQSCDREVMGYVTMGGQSFLRATGIGIGYVALPSLLEVIRKKFYLVLVRNTNKRRYKLAQFDILLDC